MIVVIQGLVVLFAGALEGLFRAPLAREDGVVLTYACLSRQTTLEGRYNDPYTGEAKPFGLLTNQWNESSAAISPDGKWLTYASDESGRSEVYVQSHPSGANRRQISNEGGGSPLWARNGRELFLSPAAN